MLLFFKVDLKLHLFALALDFKGVFALVLIYCWVIGRPSHEPLGTVDRILRIKSLLHLSSLTNDPASLCEGNNGGGDPAALSIDNDIDSIPLEDSHARVSGAKVNP